MRKIRIIFCLLTVFLLILPAWVEAKEIELNLSLNRLYFRADNGYLGRISLELAETQRFYLRGMQIGDYYSQIGKGVEISILQKSQGKLWLTFGVETYKLLKVENSLLRTGFLAEIPFSSSEIAAKVDLMLDELTGIFFCYQIEVCFPATWLKVNLGIGNLLGSPDGLAVWVGYAL